jgi:photosystem II stability/assembly factor-like uncharacterized protein
MIRRPLTVLLAAWMGASTAQADPPPRRVWREVSHGLRHGTNHELIEVGGADGRLILIGDDAGYIYRTADGGETWMETRLTPDEDSLFTIPLPRLEEIVLPNLDLFDAATLVRASGPSRTSRHSDVDDEEEEGDQRGDEEGGGNASLEPRDRSEDPGDLLAGWGDTSDEPWVNWITTCETDDLRAYAATDEGLYRSDDGGLVWFRVFVGANDPENEVLSVVCDDEDADRVYIGTRVGFFSSADAGVSWTRPRSWTGNFATCYMELDAANDGRIYVGTYGGAYVTDDLQDFADVWFPIAGSPDARWICAIVSTEQHLYLGSGDGGVVSHDGGLTFEPMAPGFLDRSAIGMMMADPRDDAHVYILTDEIFWETRDAGRTAVPLLTRQATGALTTFTLDPNDPDRVLLLTERQLLVLEPERPRPPPRAADPVAGAARRALASSPPLGDVLDAVLGRTGLDRRTVLAKRDAARSRNALPHLSIVAGLGSARRNRRLSGLGTIGVADWIYDAANDSASCRLAIRSPSCWLAEQNRDLFVADGSRRITWGVGVLLSWNLSLLAFDRAETNSIWIDVMDVQQEVVHTVADYWFERARVLRELAGAAHTAEGTRALTLRAAEMTAALDAMTGGMLTTTRHQMRRTP